MKLQCHNETCRDSFGKPFNFDYSGNELCTYCPKCSSKIPLLDSNLDISNTVQVRNDTSKFKNNLRLWLLENPKYNPYNYKIKYKSFSQQNTFSPFRKITSKIRTTPDFIIFGGTRSGCMTLTKYILEHTNVFLVRNAHFFEYMYSNKLQWYKLHFPTNLYKSFYHLKNKKKLLVGEQTGTYYAHPDVPKRIREHLPDVKLIAMFRNPVKSTYSKYYHFFNEGQELNSFDDAIKMELERIKIANENPDFVTSNPNFDSDVNFHYLRHGHYAEKLKNWFSVFPKEQILILTNDEFNADIDKTLNQVFDFLELPSYTVKNKIKHNVGKYPEMKDSTKKLLQNYFKPHNEEFYNLIGRKLDWDN
tara:strand:+ start:1429 stop:2511 length:1083 start_codon:yes stop_codon:yes gene_type:complete